MAEKMCLTKLQVREQFLAPIIVETIVITFYKATHNAGLAFNLVTIDFFEPFYAGMLAFLFAMIHYSIRRYQSEVKVIRPFDRKTVQSVYCLYIATHSHGYANIDNRYIYTDPSAIVWVQARAKTTNCHKTQAASHIYSQYHNRQYPRTDWASSQPI